MVNGNGQKFKIQPIGNFKGVVVIPFEDIKAVNKESVNKFILNALSFNAAFAQHVRGVQIQLAEGITEGRIVGGG